LFSLNNCQNHTLKKSYAVIAVQKKSVQKAHEFV